MSRVEFDGCGITSRAGEVSILPNGFAFFLPSSLTNQPILLPVAPYSEGCELSLIDDYRRMVEVAVFNRLGRPSFFDAAEGVVMRRIADCCPNGAEGNCE